MFNIFHISYFIGTTSYEIGTKQPLGVAGIQYEKQSFSYLKRQSLLIPMGLFTMYEIGTKIFIFHRH